MLFLKHSQLLLMTYKMRNAAEGFVHDKRELQAFEKALNLGPFILMFL